MSSIAYFSEIKRLRRSGMITLTLTDLLIVVVFVLLLFTFRASEEGRVEISAAQEHVQQLEAERDRLRQELADSRHEAEQLKQRVGDLEELVQRLMSETQNSTLPPDLGVIPDLEEKNKYMHATIDQLRNEIERLQRLLEQQRMAGEDDKSKGQPKDHGGTGYPRCPLTSGFLFEIKLLESGNLAITPRWEAAVSSNVRAVPGVSELADAREVSLETFRKLAARIQVWGDAQEVPCRFHVDTKTETQNLSTYRQQMSAIDKVFYPTRH